MIKPYAAIANNKPRLRATLIADAQLVALGGAGTVSLFTGFMPPTAVIPALAGVAAVRYAATKMWNARDERERQQGLIERFDADIAAEQAETQRIFDEIQREVQRQRFQDMREAQYAALGLDVWVTPNDGPRTPLPSPEKPMRTLGAGLKIKRTRDDMAREMIKTAINVMASRSVNKTIRRTLGNLVQQYETATDEKTQNRVLAAMEQIIRHDPPRDGGVIESALQDALLSSFASNLREETVTFSSWDGADIRVDPISGENQFYDAGPSFPWKSFHQLREIYKPYGPHADQRYGEMYAAVAERHDELSERLQEAREENDEARRTRASGDTFLKLGKEIDRLKKELAGLDRIQDKITEMVKMTFH